MGTFNIDAWMMEGRDGIVISLVGLFSLGHFSRGWKMDGSELYGIIYGWG